MDKIAVLRHCHFTSLSKNWQWLVLLSSSAHYVTNTALNRYSETAVADCAMMSGTLKKQLGKDVFQSHCQNNYYCPPCNWLVSLKGFREQNFEPIFYCEALVLYFDNNNETLWVLEQIRDTF